MMKHLLEWFCRQLSNMKWSTCRKYEGFSYLLQLVERYPGILIEIRRTRGSIGTVEHLGSPSPWPSPPPVDRQRLLQLLIPERRGGRRTPVGSPLLKQPRRGLDALPLGLGGRHLVVLLLLAVEHLLELRGVHPQLVVAQVVLGGGGGAGVVAEGGDAGEGVIGLCERKCYLLIMLRMNSRFQFHGDKLIIYQKK